MHILAALSGLSGFEKEYMKLEEESGGHVAKVRKEGEGVDLIKRHYIHA